MNKREFISELESRIKKYPDYQEILDYYNEVIQDKIDMNYLTEQVRKNIYKRHMIMSLIY